MAKVVHCFARFGFATKFRLFLTLAVLSAVAVGAANFLAGEESPAPDQEAQRQKLHKLYGDGNFKEAYDGLRNIVLDQDANPDKVGNDLVTAVQCLRRLGRVDEFDAFVEEAVTTHPDNWQLLHVIAQQYLQIDHHGFMISGEFHRGGHRGGGQVASALERDRVRALQLMQQALPLVQKEENKAGAVGFYQSLAGQLLYNRGHYEAWRLQYLTDLNAELPDYDDGWPYYRNWTGAPVDAEGNPVFHETVKRWEDAKTDGQRWRWALDMVVESDPNQLNSVRMQRANFLMQQFGVQTMQQWGFVPRRAGGDDGDEDESGTYALHTLEENETIARLATGIKRFELPDEHNHLKLFQQVAEAPKSSQGEGAYNQLCQIFENRRQYPKAAETWKKNIEVYGPGHRDYKKQRLAQIVDPWGQFEAVQSQPANQGATVEFRFRNAADVKFTAQPIKVGKLLDDVKAYLKSDPGRPDYQKFNIGDIGYRIVHQNETQYLEDEPAARWDLKLKPRDHHFDKRITVATPLQKPGAYLVTATIPGGNTSKIVLWVSDTAIVNKMLDKKSWFLVADAVSGKPVAKTNLEFFGFRFEHRGDRRPQVITTNFAETTDENGQVMPDPAEYKTDFQWLITARGGADDAERFAYLGFTGAWTSNYYDAEYNAIKVFPITDRPVYRPEQKMHFKFWVRHAQYDKDDVSQFAGQTFPIELFSPKGEKLWSKTLKLDEFGGGEGEWDIPKDATLGQYHITLQARDRNRYLAGGNAMFRVEEYKKPEFEVSVDAPTEPVMLGEKIQAKVKAKYYFGSPVVNATVKYKIERTSYSQDWYPIMFWDWFYGKGYWWFCYDYPWYPGWGEWVGCYRPMPWWWPQRHDPPELVAENEVPIGEDGEVEIEIDTELAKELHGDTDHKYSITAEVRDESRRTIVGSGDVLVSRKPFKVFTWVDRGYYRVGDVITANFKAQRLDGKPVEGEGRLTLYKITYQAPKGDKSKVEPVETPVRRWKLSAGEDGTASQQIIASAGGQYRLSYKVTDKAGHEIEGGYIFTIMGEGFDGSDYKFAALELIPNKKEYAPGETVKLQINTDRVGGTVLLFVRPSNGVCAGPPKTLRLTGKSTVQEIEVTKKDMPNFFVEAVTIHGGRVYEQAKELVVPPEKRVLDVAVQPNQQEYKPGEEAEVTVKLTELNGEPFVGSTVISIYDKSVEYISGGGNVGDIKEFFWKWRRSHNPRTQHSLARFFRNIVPPGKTGMSFLGVFGATVADEMDAMDVGVDNGAMVEEQALVANGRMMMRKGGAMGGMAPGAPLAMMADAAMESEGAPMDMAPGRADRAAMAPGSGEAKDKSGGGPSGGPMVEPTVRTKFADTALWVGALTTEKDGTAKVKLKMPENLTAWKIGVWAMGHGTKVGSGVAEVVTRKNLLLRLQAPRFFVQKDEVVLSANVHNYLKTDKEVTVRLEVPGEVLKPLDEPEKKITIVANGEKRVDWRVKVVAEGEAVVRMFALTDEESDATEMKFPAFVHGMLKMEAWAGTIRPDQQQAMVTVSVPEERRPEESRLEVRYSPTLAAAMVDALPYLVDYPYGCTEQTLNRFLPTVVTQKVLLDMQVNLMDVKEKRTNLNAQEIGDDQERAKQWKRFERNPVFDEEEVRRMVKDGVTRLTNMQNGDGGWGWFSGRMERSWPHTTATVVRGLQVAKANDVALVPGVLEKGQQWLARYQQEQVQLLHNAKDKQAHKRWKEKADNLDAFVYLVLTDAGVTSKTMEDMETFLYRDRIDLAVYAKAMFGLALHKQGNEQEKLDMILRNIEQFLVQDEENETAYLKLPAESYWWYWYGDEVEANAYYLKLLAATDGKGKAAPRLVKYLLNNRKHATYWSHTRDTALCVEAFADYLRASGEMAPDMTVEVWVDGEKKQEEKITKENLFTFNNKFVLTGEDVTTGKHEIELRRTGQGPVYFNAYLTNFTLEDFIEKAGLEVKVTREFYKLVPVDKEIKVAGARGQALDQKVEKFERQRLETGDEVVSGDLVLVEMTVESKNDYEYIIVEDMKAAGFEATEVRSGYNGNEMGAYVEFRDERVTFFVRRLLRGKHSVSYKLRAEIPGKFSALPTKIYAMYAPELKGNSDEMKVQVKDQE